MSADWYDDRVNLARLARYMGEQGDTVEDVAYMLEKPWKFEDEWWRCYDANKGWLRAEGARASARLAAVPAYARPVRSSASPGGVGPRGYAVCPTCSGRGVWMDNPCADCGAEAVRDA